MHMYVYACISIYLSIYPSIYLYIYIVHLALPSGQLLP